MLRPAFTQLSTTIQDNRAKKKEKSNATKAVEENYLQMVLRHAQGMHLAAPLFSLDEILIPPRLLAPLPRVEPGNHLSSEDIVEVAVPYLPTWPELAAIYNSPTLSLSEALSGNSDLVLVGQTGIGKTVALASLASSLARHEQEAGLPPDVIPVLVHVADLDLPVNKDNPLKPILDPLQEKASLLSLSRIPEFLKKVFSEGRALLMLDGTDELTSDGLKDVVDFVRSVKRAYPATRIITTASSEFLDGLVSLNFIPISLASWNTSQRETFLEKWGDLWTKSVAPESWSQTNDTVDPILLNNWVSTNYTAASPLELTLGAWGAYAGDSLGPGFLNSLETHLRRMTPVNVPREAMESVALQTNLATQPIFDPRQGRQWLKTFEQDEPESIDENESKRNRKAGKQKAPSLGLISKLVESGLLKQHGNYRMCFGHPIFAGYLAGKPLADYSDSVLQQKPWIGKYLSMQFLAAQGDASHLAKELLAQKDAPLSRNLFVISRWLRDAPSQAPWRAPVMAGLVELLQQTGQPLGLRGQALAALLQSGDTGITVLFRQFLSQQEGELLQLACLGSGATKDTKSVELLSAQLSNPNSIVRRAACLALAEIGTSEALDAVASALLHGDEILRRAAAEALSNHSGEGHTILKEGAQIKDDLQVRRAVAFGLGRIKQPWSEEILTKLQTEDDQWIVRNAASEVLEEHRKADPHIPKRLPPPSESPWLIAFAGKKGEGISPDRPPTDLLLQALKSSDPEERLASLAYIRMMPSEGVFGALYQAMYGGERELREVVFQTLTEMASRGVELPNPIQFGVGD